MCERLDAEWKILSHIFKGLITLDSPRRAATTQTFSKVVNRPG